MKNIIFKKAFTLAEIMIVLTVLGVLAAVLMPTAFHSVPNENVMKFKKVHVNLFNVINDIASSNKYYKEGDLRKKADGETNAGNNYLCQVMSEILSSKKIDCANNSATNTIFAKTFSGTNGADCTNAAICNIPTAKKKLDTICSGVKTPKGITTPDKVIWYEANQDSGATGASALIDPECSNVDCNYAYKVFCIRIDTDSFGYGIRSDGKIITSEKVDTYIERKIQDDD